MCETMRVKVLFGEPLLTERVRPHPTEVSDGAKESSLFYPHLPEHLIIASRCVRDGSAHEENTACQNTAAREANCPGAVSGRSRDEAVSGVWRRF